MKYEEAIKELADKAGVNLPEVEYSQEARKKADQKSILLEINKEAARYFYYQLRTERGALGYRYLTEKRMLSDDTVKKFGLGYSNQKSNDLYQYLKSKGYQNSLNE